MQSLTRLLLIGGALCAFPSSATIVVLHSLEEMSQRSEVIVHARVADQRVVRQADVGIVTLTDIEVIDGIKGAKAGDVLTIYQVGGSLEGDNAWISGAHRHRIGDEMVLFAVRHGERIVSYGVGVGRFLVERDGTVPSTAPNAMPSVREDLGAVAIMEKDANGQLRYTSPEPRTASSLDAFKEQVRRASRVKLPSDVVPKVQKKVLKKDRTLWQDSLRVKEGR